jgi:hypothetical protein
MQEDGLQAMPKAATKKKAKAKAKKATAFKAKKKREGGSSSQMNEIEALWQEQPKFALPPSGHGVGCSTCLLPGRSPGGARC